MYVHALINLFVRLVVTNSFPVFCYDLVQLFIIHQNQNVPSGLVIQQTFLKPYQTKIITIIGAQISKVNSMKHNVHVR